MKTVEILREYIQNQNIECDLLEFATPTHSVAQAAEAVGGNPEDFVKNICLRLDDGTLVVAIVKGEDRVSTKRVAKALESERPVTATPEEILKKTGYPIGGVPSFGYNARFLIDEKVMEMDAVYTGGGSDHALVRIAPAILLSANQGTVVKIRK